MTAIARTIVRMKFGSHLYGTATPASDQDFKSVFVPTARSILLQRVKGVYSEQRAKAENERNVASDVDEEKFSLQRFLGLLAEGQTVTVDMMFAPDWAFIGPVSSEWRELIANRHRLVTSKAAAFVKYVHSQANKYGVKGSRIAAARAALAVLAAGAANKGGTAKLRELVDPINLLLGVTEHMSWVDIPGARGDERHWEVCGRKLPLSASIGSAHEIVDRLIKEYGHRALMAESQQGVDWKALCHAVRIANQAIELLSTGRISFPRPDAQHILSIKRGERPYQEVASEIEDLLVQVEEAAAASVLPAKPDLVWIDDFVANVYRDEVLRG